MVAALLAVVMAIAPGPAAEHPRANALAASGFDPLPGPRRILDTRIGGSTWDGEFAGIGAITGGTVFRLPVAGRNGVVADADSAVVNIAAIDAGDDGFVTAYSCDDRRPGTSNVNYRRGEVVSALAIAPLASDGSVCLFARTTVHVAVDVIGSFGAAAFDALEPAERLLDTRPGESTVDGRFVGGGPLADGETIEIDVAGRGSLPEDPGPLLVSIAAVAERRGYVTAWGCDSQRPATSNLNVTAGLTSNNAAVLQLGADGRLCLFVRGGAHLVLDVVARFTPGSVSVLPDPARLVDTRPEWASVDGVVDDTGLRRGTSTLRVPVAGRAGIPSDAGSVVVNVIAVDPRRQGYVTAHPPATDRPLAANLNHPSGRNVGNLAIVPLGSRGEICLFNRSTTHLVVDAVAFVPGPRPATAAECPGQRLFPHWRMLAMYGTDSAAELGVLGEQPPDAAATLLDELARPWAALSDRPILPAFELIATVAQAAPGPSGLYRSRSSPAFVQRYLDAARRNGTYLVLDLQPGRSDFLTEARVYEEFLRQPDVGLALDPEWRTEPPETPGGGYVGRVDANEVNAVATWLAAIVEDEDLPEKLLVVHQFQDRMIVDKDDLHEPDGVALTIHMDGFGTRSQKRATYERVHVDPPWNNGFKLFFDEDIDRFGPADLLGGTVEPVPDLITYQ